MLVGVWEAMYAAIPRLEAEEQLAAYLVAATAQPAHDDEGVRHRRRTISQWQQQMRGAVRDVARRVSLSNLGRLLRGAFGEQVRQ